MTSEPAPLSGPLLNDGVDVSEVAESQPLLGQVQGEAVILIRRGNDFFAVGATCSHYGGPLAEGLVEGETIRCPWHHACFDLRTGASRAPALNAIDCYAVEQRNNRVYVLSKKAVAHQSNVLKALQRVVIVGGGAAALSAADTLRREGYRESIVMLSADSVGPVDRPNLSKDFLAGTAPEEWVPLKPPEYYAEQSIQLRLGARAVSIDTQARVVATDDGATYPFDALLLATGAEPVKLTVPGADTANLHYLRSLGDCR
ncbi:MAG TPA: FAD-dependent oxidoreductase, partial [Polyangiaceae bacterium]